MTYPGWLQEVADDPAYSWATTAWDRAAAVPGAWFDHGKAEKVTSAWPKIFRLTDDRFKGVPFKLLKWQDITVRLLVGWKKPIEVLDPLTHLPTVMHVRVFRRLDLWIPRKNGKSEFLAGLAVLFFVLEKVHKAQAFVFGRNKDQGRVPFGKMQDIIREAEGLLEDTRGNARITLNEDSFFIRETWSLCELLTGVPDGKHGRSPTVIVGDEIHEWKSRELADTLRQGTGARLQPMELYASTAGRKNGKNRTGYEWFEESMSIMRGIIDDPTVLVVYFGIGDDDDWTDEKVWKKANPSLGLTPAVDYLRTEFKKALGRPAAEAAFKCYHLNLWVDMLSGWLPRQKWIACTDDPQSWRHLWARNKGRRAYLACDIGATRDITALVVVIPPDETCEKWVIIARFWVPEGTLSERAENDKAVDWLKWAADGVVETTPGDVTDQDFVREAIKDAFAHFDIVKFGYDEWNAVKLLTDLEKDGLPPDMTIPMPQGHRTLGEGTKKLELLVFGRQLEHGGHPMLAWMAGNCIVRFDANLNYVPDKKNSLEKIDGIVATVMGVALAIGLKEEEKPTSPWDDPDYEFENG
jgi:phage terminase large subunit-like protein